MAEESTNLMEFLANHPTIEATGNAKPVAYYGKQEDALVFYFRREPEYARRLNSRITAYLSLEDDSLVGCQIKGVQSALEDLGSFDVELTDGKTTLRLLFAAFWGTVADDPAARSVYREVVKAASTADVSVEVGC